MPAAGNSQRTEKNIVLIGMPGAGKSTVGIVLAKVLGYGFVDTDIVIQQAEAKSLSEIIRENGVDGFRRVEEKHAAALALSRTVIATGGSVVYGDRAMAALKSAGRVVFLDLSLPLLSRRLDDMDGRGVVRLPGQTLADLLAERLPLYRKWADIRIPCDGLAPEQVMNRIRDRLG
ncbi:MAG: shikimate kinase [Desulfobacterales bacterium]|nr:MAG: shikimate kinase [Desulfobacterales bacterium]